MDPNMTLIHQQQQQQQQQAAGHSVHARRKNNRTASHGIPSERMSLSDEAKMEMTSLPTKTPVSVLQELLSRRGATPKYELVQIEGAIHEPIFRYRVFINNDFVATGTGRSKKDAKHAAAKNLLDVLIGKQTPEQAISSNGTLPAPEGAAQVVSPFDDKVMGNPIGWLQEMCMSRRWPPPSYLMEHEEGLPHERQFTIACQVLKYREVGIGTSKKLAKRRAAHKMWQALQDMPPEGNNVPPGLDEDEELTPKLCNSQTRYTSLKASKISTITTQHSYKVSQFHKTLKQSTGPKLKDLQNVNLNKKEFNTIQFLHEIATEQQFEVTYVDIEEKAISGHSQCLVQLSTLPVAVCYGSGPTPKDAQSAAAQNALEYLKIMTKK